MYNKLFKIQRNKGAENLPILQHWGARDWSKIFKQIRNCSFFPMKINQLIHNIITDSMFSGDRLQIVNKNSNVGKCPYCNTNSTVIHMFSECPIIKDVWKVVEEFGKRQWPDITNFSFEDIPQLTAKYTPSAILKTSVLWSIWLAWCKLFYENQTEFEMFYDNIINGTFSTLRARINEFPATIQ